MGLFDFFKKKSTQPIPQSQNATPTASFTAGQDLDDITIENKKVKKCAECMCKIQGHIWRLGKKDYCQECYNRRMALGLRGFTVQKLEFEMVIDDIFLIKDHGVAVTGTIKKGCIYESDTVLINGCTYTVKRIHVRTNETDHATAGMNVGLLLSTMDAGLFKRGDVVTLKALPENQSKTTFVCDVCEKELPLKYRHKGNTCVTCSESKTVHTTQPTPQPLTTTPPTKFCTDEYLDDITFIREMKHIPVGPWHQYDVLLAARGYGWDMMKDWADYMAEADLEHISQVTVGTLGVQARDITESYSNSGGKCKNTPELNAEMGMLSVAGISKALTAPMKVVWINQTQVLRFFTLTDDELLIKQYVETMIRRTFGTENAMKLGKPIPKEQ